MSLSHPWVIGLVGKLPAAHGLMLMDFMGASKLAFASMDPPDVWSNVQYVDSESRYDTWPMTENTTRRLHSLSGSEAATNDRSVRYIIL
jgi:hypothetical protein